ncbi:MAG: hypothetical protein HW415_1205 [Deltaproteobacteria bacterium]|nr:hypothetical protein [Deltaproteobacteria bacterium]
MNIFKMFTLIGLIGIEVMSPLHALGKEPQDIIVFKANKESRELTIRKINVRTVIQPFLQRK